MKTYLIYKDVHQELTCYSVSEGIIKSFSDHGCICLSESQFLMPEVQPSEEDCVIILISLKNENCHQKLLSLNCKKILYSNDESKSDQILFRTQLEFCKRHGVTTIINTFPSDRNLNFLTQNGIRAITMPVSGWHRNVNFANKDIDVLVSGQIVESYYPVRTKIFSALRNSTLKFAYLPHSGMEASNVMHQYHGKNFLNLLDRCWLGVTCRAGSFRDRMVPKYVEFGFSKVLPVGDCPTYMDPDMKSSMIEITESSTEDFIINQIKNALADKQKLIDRIEKYSSVIHEKFDMVSNTKRVLRMISNNEFDS